MQKGGQIKVPGRAKRVFGKGGQKVEGRWVWQGVAVPYFQVYGRERAFDQGQRKVGYTEEGGDGFIVPVLEILSLAIEGMLTTRGSTGERRVEKRRAETGESAGQRAG